MAKINVTSGTASAYGQGELQLQNKAPMDGTLRPVTDSANTASPLLLSTSLVQTTSTLKITTSDNPYIDAEDNSGNNRFTVGRDPASQQVNVDFASNPTGSTTAVGAIRTYADGVNLSEAMTFREDGNVGINTNTPGSKLDVHSASNVIAQFNRTGAGKSWIQYLQAGTARWNTGYDNVNGNFTIYDAVNATDRMVVTNAGNVGIGTDTPYGKFDVRGGAISRTTTDFVPVTSGSVISLGLGASTGNTYGSIIVGNTGDSIAGNLVLSQFGGNVGIGTTTPSQKLEVAGVIKIGDGVLSGGGGVELSSEAFFGFAAQSNAYKFRNGTNTTTYAILDSDGLKFNGDTAAANALDDYEEGTWTPVLANDGPGVFTLTTQFGKYTKIGNVVQINGYISWSSNTSITGQAIVGGLPFSMNNSTTPIANQIAIHEQNGGVAQGVHFRHDNTTSVPQGYSYNFDGSASGAVLFGVAGYIAINATYFV
jgi:hypothetical protein